MRKSLIFTDFCRYEIKAVRVRNVKLFGLVFLSSFIVACDRAKGPSSKVTIQMPQVAGKVSASFVALPLPGTLTDPLDFSLVVPDTERYPINCYAIAIGGPVPELSGVSCGRRIAGGTSLDPNQIKLRAGMWLGNLMPGQEINLELNNGPDRDFYVIGYHATSDSCSRFTEQIDLEKMTRPYILAQKRVNLTGGDVQLQMNLDIKEDAWFNKCEGRVFSDQKEVAPVATRVVLKKPDQPMDRLIDGACHQLDFHVLSDTGARAAYKDNKDIYISHVLNKMNISTSTMATETDSATSTYANADDCAIEDNESDFFTIPAGVSSVSRWVKSPESDGTHYPVDVQVDLRIGATVTPALSSVTFPVQVANTKYYQVVGPKIVNMGVCYPYMVSVMINAQVYQPTGTDYDFVVTSLPTGATRHSGPNCLASDVSAAPVSMQNQTQGIFYLKFTDMSAASFTVTQQTPSVPVVTSTFALQTASNANTLAAVEILGPNMVAYTSGDTAKCRGPFHLSAVSTVGSAWMPTITMPFIPGSTDITGSGGLTFGFYSNSACNVALPAAIAANAGPMPFYVKVQGTYIDNPSAHITVTSSVNGAMVSRTLRLFVVP